MNNIFTTYFTILGNGVNAIGTPSVPTGFIIPSEGQGKIAGAINFAFTLAFVISTVYIILAGFQYITSSGDPGRIKTALATLQWAILGLIVTLSAYVIARVVGSVFGITDWNLGV